MSEAPHFIAVDLESFQGVTRDIDFDVYLKLSEQNYAHVFSRTTGLDYKRLAGYAVKGVRELHIRQQDYPAYQAFIARPATSIFEDPNASREKKIAALLNMTEQNMAELFSQFSIPEKTAENSRRLINNYVDLMVASPNTLATILKLVSHGEYLYYHSIAVSIFSLFIAKATGLFHQNTLELIGMGGFLHDIGHTQVPKEATQGAGPLTSEQRALVESHPKIGLEMLAQANTIPEQVRFIVYQHHEQPGGAGYPNSLPDSKIFYPAKVVAVADVFSALISKRPFRPAYSVDEALQLMMDDRQKFDQDLVRILVSILQRSKKEAA